MFTATLIAQGRVANENLHTRILCVVPMVGSGSAEDPKRPMFVPKPPDPALEGPGAVTAQPGILAFQYQLSDDGNYALVEFVGIDRKALAEILDSKDTRVKVFEPDKAKRDDIEKEFKKFKRNFSLDKYIPVRAQ